MNQDARGKGGEKEEGRGEGKGRKMERRKLDTVDSDFLIEKGRGGEGRRLRRVEIIN